jgi:hypothetical protein
MPSSEVRPPADQAAEVNAAEPTAEASPFNQSAHPTISAYFESFNQADFQATAALFAVDGQLLPPFETPISGREAIAAYLEREAKGMKAVPQTIEEGLVSDDTNIQVTGQVQTPLFGVNVNWQFLLNSQSEILSVKIKLLAALRDLLHLKR